MSPSLGKEEDWEKELRKLKDRVESHHDEAKKSARFGAYMAWAILLVIMGLPWAINNPMEGWTASLVGGLGALSWIFVSTSMVQRIKALTCKVKIKDLEYEKEHGRK